MTVSATASKAAQRLRMAPRESIWQRSVPRRSGAARRV
uniref:Uncharacterized protein n=1 Tax=Arundo donax TaxID=35708 RepID=A0A0A8YMX2_ARUDO